MSEPKKWEVLARRSRFDPSYEIAVVCSAYAHGKRSWGWFCNEKILVAASPLGWNGPVLEYVWSALLAVAEDLCARLNAGERIK